jgi:hypothetical protein
MVSRTASGLQHLQLICRGEDFHFPASGEKMKISCFAILAGIAVIFILLEN